MNYLHNLIRDLRRNYGGSLWGRECACGQIACGSDYCAHCCEKAIAELTNMPDAARRFHHATREAAKDLRAFEKRMEEIGNE